MDFINDMIRLIMDYYPLLLEGIFNTLLLATLGTIFGIIIGLIIAMISSIEVTSRDKGFVKFFKKSVILLTKIYVLAYLFPFRSGVLIKLFSLAA